MDGILGAVQERMRGSSSPTALQLMLNTNGWSSVLLMPLFIWQMFDFVPFAAENPSVIASVAMLTVASSIGQIFIFIMITSFGSLACSIVTTSRKFFTTFYSAILSNSFSVMNWCGVFLVFVGLFADIAFGKKSDTRTTAETQCQENLKNQPNLEESKAFTDKTAAP